ncbi:MAG: sigma-70 family RNA polymerase sigma factor [Sphingobacteriaceae bacterium]|nr:MAG: sigma-70 family RNA polymerase sigma factor [Sphingobacteriaceae bacterium]
MSLFSKKKKRDEPDDDRLLRLYTETGNLDVLGELYQWYMPMVYGVCLKYLQDEERSKDAVMQIFEELIVKVTQQEIKQFRSWLYVLSRNFCLMQLRSLKKIETVSIDQVMEFAFVLHLEEENSEARMKILESCMQKLTPAQQQSIELFYLQEKCYREVAKATGYTLNEVKSYLQNGKRNLKICMDNHREH